MTIPTKSDLRSSLKRMRKEFVFEQKYSTLPLWDGAISNIDRLIRSDGVVAAYLPFGSECDLHDVMTHIDRQMARIALPFLAAPDAPMVFRAWRPGDPTAAAPGGFQQPLSSQPILTPNVILLPLVGFDRAGNRLGQGAGHYDRALAALPAAIRVGAAWSVQEVPALPADPWDVPLDAVMTEAEWIVPQGSRLERI